MRNKKYMGRFLSGLLAAALLLTSISTTAYAIEEQSEVEIVTEQEENTQEEDISEETEENPSNGENDSTVDSGENNDDSESGENQIGNEEEETDPEPEEDEKVDENPELEDTEIIDDGTAEEDSTQDIIEETVSDNSLEETVDTPHTNLHSTMSVRGKNSVGTMLADALADKTEEQLENNGYNVFAVEMEGQSAKVSFETLEDAVLTVAIYDEAGKRLLASGSQEVNKEEKTAVVEIVETVPQYFYVRSFLTDKESLRPLCPLYDSPMYTKEMQEFLAKTTDDFDEDRVLNLDDDKTNNFAVYNEDAIVIPDKDGVNILVSADEESNIYVIENADGSITSLKEGDIFVYEYEEYDFLIVKIAVIEVDGTTVTIMGEKLSMEEVFDYVKIDAEAGLQEAEVDASDLEEGVIYEGIVPYSDGDIETYAIDEEAKGNVAASYKLDKKLSDKAKLSGSLDFSMEASVKVYLSFKYQYLEVKFDYSVKLQGSISAEDTLKIVLSIFRIYPIPGIYIEFTPSFIVEAKGKASWSGTLKGTIGEAVSSDEGARNLTSAPDFKSEFKAEISIFLGISLAPEIGVVSEKIAAASMDATVGVEVKGSLSYKEPSTSKVHGCVSCIDGDIAAKIKVECKAKIFNSDKWTAKTGIEKTIIIADFYYSLDLAEFGWGKCPHYLYKVEVTVTDKNGVGLKEAKITTPVGFYVQKDSEKGQTITDMAEAIAADVLITDEKGVAIGYLFPGDYILSISKEEYGIIEKKIHLFDKEKAFRVKFRMGEENGGNTGGGSGEQPDIKFGNEKLDLGGQHSAVITVDGSLYTWGYNSNGQLGDGTQTDRYIPIKVLDQVMSISLGYNHSAAVTTDGSLYTWGWNRCGQLGDGTTTDKHAPMKVLDQVVDVSLGYQHSAAITAGGSLYIWGLNRNGQLGDGTKENKYTPVKILEHVVSISLGKEHSAAITEDGSLYMWGYNGHGQLGDGTKEDKYTPVKVLDQVAYVSLGEYSSAVITMDGCLYAWGEDCDGQLGDGDNTREDKCSPVKILDQVVDVSLGYLRTAAIVLGGDLYVWGRKDGETQEDRFFPEKIFDQVASISLGSGHCGVITTDGNLYTWGLNSHGQLGDGTTENKSVPTRISLAGSIVTSLNSVDFQQNKHMESQNQITAEEQLETSIIPFPKETVSVPANYTVQADGTTGNVRFFDLVPEETYNFYVVESRDVENPLDPSNLLYIDQYTADSSGSLAATYEAKHQSDTAVAFVVGMSKINLADAEVSVPDMMANGSTQYAMPKVTFKGTPLTEGVDYEITDNAGGSMPGTYSVTLTGIGLYTGEVTAGYRIVENPQSETSGEADTLKAPTASVQSGAEVDAGMKVRLFADTAGAAIYYTLDGTFPTKDSMLYTAPIVIEQDTIITAYAVKAGYIDSETVTFRYTVKDISGYGDILTEDIPQDGVIPEGLWMSDIAAQTYTGKAIRPEVRVYDHKTLLEEKKDYLLSYKNNVKANDASVTKTAPTITVTGKGNYAGKETQNFVIVPKNLADEDVLADSINASATNKTQYPIPKVIWQGKNLTRDRDFIISYPSTNGTKPYQSAGSYEIQIEGKGNFAGRRIIDFIITDSRPVSKLTVLKIASQTYTGEAISPVLTVKDGGNILTEGKDYTVSYQNNVSVGTASAVISGMGSYVGIKSVSYKITPIASIKKAKAEIFFKNTTDYTGREVRPDDYSLTMTLKDADRKDVSVQLLEGTDYTVSYQNNHKVGTATIIFTGINGYNGILKKTYKIIPYDIKADSEKAAEADKKIVVRLRDSYVYAKGGCKPEPVVTFQGKALKKDTDYTLSYKNNKTLNNGSDSNKLPVMTVKGKGNFKGSVSVTYLIEKQELKKVTLTLKDKVWQNKQNIYRTTITLTDMDGKKLSAGKDYDKNATYVYDSDTILADQSTRKAGEEVAPKDIIPAGTVIKVTVNETADGNYTGKVSATYRITTADISKAAVKIPAQTYTGRAIEPDDQIEVRLNRTLISKDNYEIVSYQNNVNKGTATVTIRGKNDCGGSKTVKFKIRQKGFIWWRR